AVDTAPADALGRCLAILNQEEREQAQRFVFERDRTLYLIAHALVRTTLSRYVPVAPAAWKFRTNEYGRPGTAASAQLPPLRFNLSHVYGLAACVVTLALDAGVDVEETGRDLDIPGVAAYAFAPDERAVLAGLAGAAQRRRFFEYWTLKEA